MQTAWRQFQYEIWNAMVWLCLNFCGLVFQTVFSFSWNDYRLEWVNARNRWAGIELWTNIAVPPLVWLECSRVGNKDIWVWDSAVSVSLCFRWVEEKIRCEAFFCWKETLILVNPPIFVFLLPAPCFLCNHSDLSCGFQSPIEEIDSYTMYISISIRGLSLHVCLARSV